MLRTLRWWIVVLALAGCSEGEETGVLLVVEAQPRVVARARGLDITIYGGPSTPDSLTGLRRRDIPPDVESSWPILVGLSPRSGDADRVWGADLRAVDLGGNTLVALRARGSYVAGRVPVVTLVLEDACFEMECGETLSMTCAAGACVTTPETDVSLAEDWDGRRDFENDPPPPEDGGVAEDGGDAATDASQDAPDDAADA